MSILSFHHFQSIKWFSMIKIPSRILNYSFFIFLWLICSVVQAGWEQVGSDVSSGKNISNLKLIVHHEMLYVAFVDETNSRSAVVRVYDTSKWNDKFLLNNIGGNDNKSKVLDLNFDSNNTPYIAFIDKNNSKSAVVQKYPGSGWENVGGNLSPNKDKIYDLNLALDSTNIPYVAFINEANSKSAVVQKYTGSEWENVGENLSPNGDKISDLNLALDSTNIPYVAFINDANSKSTVVQKYNGSGWDMVGGNLSPNGDEISDLNLALDRETPYVAFLYKQKEVIVKRYIDKWEEIECGKIITDQGISELTLAANDSVLYIGFKEGNNVAKVMRYNPTICPILTEPADQTILTGTTATLMVEAQGNSSYQWYQIISGDESIIPGATSATFETPSLTATTSYRVHVTHGTEKSVSRTATITVQEPPSVPSSQPDSTSNDTLDPDVEEGNTSDPHTENSNTLDPYAGREFVPQEFTLFVEIHGKGKMTSIPTGIHCDESDCHDSLCDVQRCSLTLPTLTPVTLIPQPAQDSEFSSWGGNPDCDSGSVTLDRSLRCVAYFHPLPKKLKVTHFQRGQVSSFPTGLSCDAKDTTCEHQFKSNTLVRLSFTPQDAWFLAGWSGDCNDRGEVRLDQDAECSPQVLPLPQKPIPNPAEEVLPDLPSKEVYILTVEMHGQGNILFPITHQHCQNTCTQDYEEGALISIIAQAREGYVFSKWGGACQGTVPEFQITMTTHQYCEAYFQAIAPPKEEVFLPTETAEHIPNQPATTEAVNIEPQEDFLEEHWFAIDNIESSSPEEETQSLEPISSVDEFPDSELCPLEGTIDRICHYQDGEELENVTVGTQGNISNVVLKGILHNQGWISNMKLAPESFLDGGVLTGYITNEGTIQDVVFRGATLAGGTLAGILVLQNGIVQNIKLAPDSYLRGGQLQGRIEGNPNHPALLEEVSITNDTELSHVILGQGVKLAPRVHFGPGVVFANLSSPTEQETLSFPAMDQDVENPVLKNLVVNQGDKYSHVVLIGKIVNQGSIADSILQKESVLTGGILTGQFINYGTLKNVEFQGNYLRGGLLTGEIKNTQGGILEGIELNDQTHLVGGKLIGPIEGHGAFIEQATLQGKVTQVVIGQQVKNEGIIKDSEFRGELMEGGQISGHLANTQGGTLRDVYFLANSSLHGGNLQGKVIGDPDAPARLDHVRIAQGSYLENVILGDQVFLSEAIELGPGVRFISQRPPQSLKPTPPLLAVGVDRQGQVVSSHTTFAYHLETDQGQESSGALLSQQAAQKVTASAILTLGAEHVGQAGEIVLASVYKPSPTEPPTVYMRTNHRWLPWDYQLSQLRSVKTFQKLPKKVTVPIFAQEDLSALPGAYTLLVGYRLLDTQTIIYNGKMPFSFFVDSTPKNCILYAVHDEKKNDSQFIKIDLSHSLWGTMQAFGPLYQGRDIEGLTLHPSYPHVLYATSGDDANVDGQKLAGYLYTIDKKTARLNIVGPTGFDQVAALGIDPVEKILWGWGEINQGQQRQWSGLIQIDPKTGKGTPIKQFSSQETMGGLAVSPEGHQIYTSSGKTLWVYDKQTQVLKKICGQITQGRIEGLDMQPNGTLLLGIDLNQTTTITAYDPQKCEVIKTRTYQEVQYDDIESIVWPAAECNDQSWLTSHSE